MPAGQASVAPLHRGTTTSSVPATAKRGGARSQTSPSTLNAPRALDLDHARRGACSDVVLVDEPLVAHRPRAADELAPRARLDDRHVELRRRAGRRRRSRCRRRTRRSPRRRPATRRPRTHVAVGADGDVQRLAGEPRAQRADGVGELAEPRLERRARCSRRARTARSTRALTNGRPSPASASSTVRVGAPASAGELRGRPRGRAGCRASARSRSRCRSARPRAGRRAAPRAPPPARPTRRRPPRPPGRPQPVEVASPRPTREARDRRRRSEQLGDVRGAILGAALGRWRRGRAASVRSLLLSSGRCRPTPPRRAPAFRAGPLGRAIAMFDLLLPARPHRARLAGARPARSSVLTLAGEHAACWYALGLAGERARPPTPRPLAAGDGGHPRHPAPQHRAQGRLPPQAAPRSRTCPRSSPSRRRSASRAPTPRPRSAPPGPYAPLVPVPLAPVAAAIAFSRVYFGVHYPIRHRSSGPRSGSAVRERRRDEGRDRRHAERGEVLALQRADEGGGGGRELPVHDDRAERRDRARARRAPRRRRRGRRRRRRSSRTRSPSTTSPGSSAAPTRARGSATSSWPTSARRTRSSMSCVPTPMTT